MTTPIIRPLSAEDHSEWDRLYEGYCDFYHVPSTEESRRVTFGWLLDPNHVQEGLGVELDGKLVGLAHFREQPRPLHGKTMGFLDDLFVDPQTRGNKIGEAVFDHLREICRERGWFVLRWLTQDHNYRARALYDRIGSKSLMNTYEMVID